MWSGETVSVVLMTYNERDSIRKVIEDFFATGVVAYRLMRKDTARWMADEMSVGGSHAGPEMMMLAINSGRRFVEVPVNYLPRVGTSSVTGHPVKTIARGLTMIRFIFLTTRFNQRKA